MEQKICGEICPFIRRAKAEDASRIAEILVFTKRMNYRRIFHDDQVSFGEIQVYPLAKRYLDEPKRLEGIWVYDDGFVKAMIHMEGEQICELYVDSFFEGEGIGGKLIEFACGRGCRYLWVLKKNEGAIRFYERHHFIRSEEERLEEGTEEYLVKMVRMEKECEEAGYAESLP
jgi:putative acetyltransferase